jgi:hypothetical protein
MKINHDRKIWIADFGGDCCAIGFMVTQGSIGRPYAFVPNNDPLSNRASYELAQQLAGGEIDPGDCWQCIDLRCYGLPDSNAPMPGFIYGIGHHEILNDNIEKIETCSNFIDPYCKFRK